MARPDPHVGHPSGSPLPPVASRSRLWWALSPVYTFGWVAFVPALHAAITLRQRVLWWWAGGLILGDVLAWGLYGTGSYDDEGSDVTQNFAFLLLVVLAVTGTVHALRLRGAVFAPPPPPVHVDPAVSRSLAARTRREESVALGTRDPGLARDLRIGRPDLTRDYDDGGLVDVNHVPQSFLVSHLELTELQAAAVVAARDHIGGFQDVEDLGSLAGVPPRTLDAIRDRVVVL